MIDQTLIASNSLALRKSLLASLDIGDGLYSVKEPFTSDALKKLHHYLHDGSDKPWEQETTSDYKIMDVARRKISWQAESIVEEMHEVCSQLTDLVAQRCQRAIQFHGITLWEDCADYAIDWHTDNPVLAATLQIYLFGDPQNPGTEFELLDGRRHVCDFVPNTGYFIDQTKHRLQHRTTGKVPASTLRYSLFSMWT